jgi:hypothetical protein
MRRRYIAVDAPGLAPEFIRGALVYMRRHMKRVTLVFLLCMLCFATASESGATAGVKAARAMGAAAANLSVTGTVIGIGGQMAGRSRPFTLLVNRYTSADDVARLNSALQSGGQDELMRVLSKLDAGRISIGNNVGVTANAVIATPTGEGRTRMVVLYQRNVNFYELRYGARSEDYRFGYAEIFLDRQGHGEGTFIPAAKVRLRDGNTWEVEDFGVFPARLIGLRSHGSVGGAR